MKAGVISDSTKTAKGLAQEVAKRIGREPLEVLKQTGEQIGVTPPVESAAQSFQPRGSEKPVTVQEKQKRLAKARSLYTALRTELQEYSQPRMS